MQHYFKIIALQLIAVIGIMLLPIQGKAQTADSISIKDMELLFKPLQKPKFKGWYFGLNTGMDESFFRYAIPEDPKTGYTGTNTNGLFFGEIFEASIGRRVCIQTNAKYVVGKFLTIDFVNFIKEDGGDVIMYQEYSGGGWISFTSRYEPREIYHLRLITNHFSITPNLTLGSPNLNFFFGFGLGCTSVLSRKGNLGDSLQFRPITVLYKANLGFNARIRGGIASIILSGNRTDNMAKGGWRSYIGFNTLTLGYALPIAAFKRNSKTATL